MSHITHRKQALRHIFKAKRRSMSPQAAEEQSRAICSQFITHLLPRIYDAHSRTVFSLYLASYGEVATNIIADYFTCHDIVFAYPKITKQNHPLDFILSQKNQTLTSSPFFANILEPSQGVKTMPDIIILPLLAFDAKLSRLGMGGGFFDRTIAILKKKKPITIIGLAYDYQGFEDDLPVDENDQGLDFIVTSSQIISRS